MTAGTLSKALPAVTPRGPGHRFVLYGDACSGLPGALHEGTFAAVNAVVRRLDPQPEFIVFPGDEITGLTRDEAALRDQWRHWFEVEMAWLDRSRIPLFHTTANHTTYDPISERVFAEVMAHLPRNGPPGQEGLSYWVRRGDLLMVFVHTLWSGLGGEGHVETEWLDATLAAHADARVKLVIGHHPVFPVNGFAGAFQRDIGPPHAAPFWDALKRHGVFAYLCSHILAFDVQVHDGILQVCTAGAGTAHRMPEGVEYLHCLTAAIDGQGMRYRVLDIEGTVREALSWPPTLPPAAGWMELAAGEQPAPDGEPAAAGPVPAALRAWRFTGIAAQDAAARQTLVSARGDGAAIAPLWIGISGPDQRLTVSISLSPNPGRSPHYWHGPALTPGKPFDLTLALHGGMGPGGVLWRVGEDGPWSTLEAASASGPEMLPALPGWTVGHGDGGPDDRPFLGRDLRVTTVLAPQEPV
ncbi:hypothetical protein [Thalassobaculum sp.]|uniref:metallophosphoesterase family protein n=1 Tax=Thalassobaculum sp. TaxID=2022740 RepID=UPI0032EE6D9C